MFQSKSKFTEAYNTYFPLVFSVIYNKVDDIHLAEDLSQEIFSKFFEKIESVENVRKWLYGAIRNELLYYYRKKNNNVNIDDVLSDTSLKFVNGFRDIRIILQEALENSDNFKDDNEQALFDMIAIRDYTYEEAGKELGLTKRQARYKFEVLSDRLCKYLKTKGINDLDDLL